jgi:phage terminase Nu1 subunit (DNA packaging protein)
MPASSLRWSARPCRKLSRSRWKERAPTLLDRQGLGQALGCSLATVDRLRREVGFPELRVGDGARFELDAVLAWLRNREPSADTAEGSAAPNPEKHVRMPSNTNGFSHGNSAMAADRTAASKRKSQ